MFAHSVGILLLAFKFLKVIKENPSTFSCRTTIPFIDGCLAEDLGTGRCVETCAFLGLTNYFRPFVKNFSLIAKPLTILTSKDQPWTWGHVQQQAFETLKQKLGTTPVLRCLDVSKSFQLHTDWSSLGLGAVLTQKDDFGWEYVVAYVSRSNNTVEANYSSYEGEAHVAVWAIANFQLYFYGQQFTLVTEHQPLRWFMKSDKLTYKLAKWILRWNTVLG